MGAISVPDIARDRDPIAFKQVAEKCFDQCPGVRWQGQRFFATAATPDAHFDLVVRSKFSEAAGRNPGESALDRELGLTHHNSLI
jgi:hypothetical protein